MNSNYWIKGAPAILGSVLLGLMFVRVAAAANPEPVVVEVEFIAAVTIAETNAMQFGMLDVGMLVTETVAIATDSSVTDANDNVVGPAPSAATFNTTAVPARAINLLVENISNGTYYTLGSWSCDYDGDTAGACNGGGLSETSVAGSIQVRVGVTLTGLGSAIAGGDNGSFDLTITYE